MRIVVIGAGLLGLTTAWNLRQHGCEVTVIDRADGPGRETSFANGGMLHASQANPWNEPGVLGHALRMLGKEDAALLFRLRALPGMLGWGLRFIRNSKPARYLRNFEKNAHLARYSLDQMAGLREVIGTGYHYDARGTLKLFRTTAGVAAAAEMCRQLADWGIAFDVVDGTGAVELEPALAPIVDKLAGGLYFPADEAGDAHRFCELLAGSCAERGVRFHYGSPVKRLLRDGSRMLGVSTVAGEYFEADAFVLAAGSYSAPLARQLGLAVPVQPAKGYSITVPSGEWAGRPTLPVIDDFLHAAVCPLGDRLRVAGTAEFAGYDLSLTPSRIANLFKLLTQLYPSFKPHLDPARVVPWTGLRPMSADGVGIMGRTALPNVHLNTGHGPLGWTMAAGAGKLVADEVVGQPTALDLAAYRLARFG
jgi:D-amino-acid dehydrogenase